ncbi:MAG: TetR/AcrR family transcriptional regulator [Geminicoccaceae bacterium]
MPEATVSDGSDAPTEAAAGVRQRLSPRDRERMILDGAVRYFAANGFDGDTRALARSLGVSQALIFHYFPTKEALIDAIYQEVFLSRWKREWDQVLTDRSRPLRPRLKAFYRDYHRTADRPEWIRLTLYSALRDIDINARYHRRVRERIIHRIARELRYELALDDPDGAISQYEEQVVYTLHAGVIYHLIRKHVYRLPSPEDLAPVIDAHVDLFMDSLPDILRRLAHEHSSKPAPTASA